MPPPPNSEWQLPRWVTRDKHHARGVISEEEAMKRSDGRDGEATYLISRAEAKILELSAIQNPFPDLPNPNEIEPRKTNMVRHFWVSADRTIGASRGELTRFVYVVYSISGEFHGYPVTSDELRQKGVNI